MTLESTINKNRYIGNGATTQFPFTFKIWETDQILVYVGDGETEQEVSAQCTIILTASGGTVTFSTAPASGTVIVLRRNMPYKQEDDYRNGTRFDSEEVEDRFDQDCAERQDLRLDVDRAIKVPLTSDKTPEEYQQDFWSAYGDSQTLHASVVGMHAEVLAERPKALTAISEAKELAVEAVQDAGDQQIERLENIAPIIMADTGNACMEMCWALSGNVAANSDIDISPLWYVVGRHHLRVSVNGVLLYKGRQFEEKGQLDSQSSLFTTLIDLRQGDVVNVWINHLSGKNVSSTATHDYDGLMAAEDKIKIDAVPIPSSLVTTPTRQSTTLNATLVAGTEFVVPAHVVGGSAIVVFHNGVLCEPGVSGQYLDFSTTSIKFNYDIPAGDMITICAVRVGE